MTYSVGIIVGSLSAQSINRKLAKALVRLAPADLEFTWIEIGDLPLYNHDLDTNYPPEAVALKEQIESKDAILFVTPEYNRSIPGALKNAIDWASRPWGTNSFDGRPTAVIGASIGQISTALAQGHLRNILHFLNSPIMGQPEAYIAFRDGLITDEGEVTNEATTEFLSAYLQAFTTHIERHSTALQSA